MAQIPKLKSERRTGNQALMDLFLTLDPPSFETTAKRLSHLFDADKKGFNLLLEKFDGLKETRMKGSIDELRKKKFISNTTVNDLLTDMLWHYWNGQQHYAGGYLKRMLPKQKENEPALAFSQRMSEMEDVFGILFVHVLRECEYFKR